MSRPSTPHATTCLSLLLAIAAAQPVCAMGRWPEPSIDEDAKDTMTSLEGTITGLNLESDPPLVQVVSKTGKKLVLLMDDETTAVWINDKLKRIRHLKLGDGVRLFYVKREHKGLVTGIEVLTRAAKPKPSTLMEEDIQALKKRPPALKPPPRTQGMPSPSSSRPPVIAPAMVPTIQRPIMPGAGTTSTTTERRPTR